MAHVMTVRGPVDPSELGPTMTHEHIFLDFRHAWSPSAEILDADAGTRPFETRLAGVSRWNQSAYRNNLVQSPKHDYALISEEVGEYVRAGGGAIVELTVIGLNPEPEALLQLSEDLDVHIVAGVGFYVGALHPPWVEVMSVPQLTDFLRTEVTDGMGGTSVRPGIIGEIGTSETLLDAEERVLRASARVAVETDTPINVHCHPPTLEVVQRILDGYPSEEPNRTDIDPHALNTNAPQIINNDNIGGTLDQQFSENDQLVLRYQLTSQKVDAFQLYGGQNPDTTTKSHDARASWIHSWSPSTVTEFSGGFKRIGSLLVSDGHRSGR